MNQMNGESKAGMIYTFYSFKGGVGRSMALANCAVLLAKWGFRVLVIDWDLEAPGLARFFSSLPGSSGDEVRKSKPGILDLVLGQAQKENLDWRDCIIEVQIPGSNSNLHLITAGRDDEQYSKKLHSLDFPKLFEDHDLGTYIELLRKEWAESYDFILLDSRTGVTDIGGICTVHLADVLVVFFTTTDSSMLGARQIVDRARAARAKLPRDRASLLAVPVPSRDESRTEYSQAQKWKLRISQEFSDIYEDWLPTSVSPKDAIELLRIPYIPFWSFGENLPVIVEGTKDPSGLGRAYEVLARLLSSRMDWSPALEGASLPPSSNIQNRSIDSGWLEAQRISSKVLFTRLPPSRPQGGGFLEAFYGCIDSEILLDQKELLRCAQVAAHPGTGWPVGVVLHSEDAKPKPTKQGIRAQILRGAELDFWALNKQGDFYCLRSPFEKSSENKIFFDIRIFRIAELLAHCHRLYMAMGVHRRSKIEFTLIHKGFADLTLDVNDPARDFSPVGARSIENQVTTSISFSLAEIETDFVAKLIELCEPFFILFDFTQFEREVYEELAKPFSDLQRK